MVKTGTSILLPTLLTARLKPASHLGGGFQSSFSTTHVFKMPTDQDRNLEPHTSGRAAALAAKYASEHPLKLYGGWFCPFVQRSWITLHEKNIPHQYVEINPYHKDPDFLALNPRGLVPTLAVPIDKQGQDQRPLYESAVICPYLDEVYTGSQHGESLLPQDAYERARCRLWIDHISSRIIPGFYRFLQHTPEKNYTIDEARQEFLRNIKTFAKEINEQGPFFLGESFSMVDLMLAPWAARLFLIDHYKPGGLGIPAETESADAATWAKWKKWFDATMSRPSVLDTLSDRDQYIEAYKRYAEDTTGSEVGQATRKGRGLP